MNRIIGLLLLVPMLFLAAHAQSGASPGLDALEGGDAMALIAGAYQYEGDGFGGDFTITLDSDGTYEFYEGYLSSYMGMGTWHVADDVVHMTEGDAGFELSFAFGVEEDALVYLAAESDAFPYVALSDGARFNRECRQVQGAAQNQHGVSRAIRLRRDGAGEEGM